MALDERAASSTCRPDRRPPTSTAPIGSATTSSPTRCSRSTPTPASASGTSSSCATTSGIAICRRRRRWSRVGATARTIDAVAQATKHGYVFVFDRATGEPLFPIEDRTFPPSTVPGEVAATTQPLPDEAGAVRAAAADRGHADHRTPEAHQWALGAVHDASAATGSSCRSRSASRR